MAEPVVLVAHGSQDPRAAETTRALARAISAARPTIAVRESFLDHTSPAPGAVLHELEDSGHAGAVLVPLLLTSAYHGRVDIPEAVAGARAAGLRLPVRVTGVVGPATGATDGALLDGLTRRLAQAGPGRFDALVLMAAGTRNAAARQTVELVAERLGERYGVPAVAGYASAAAPTPDVAVQRLREAGAGRVAVAAYFLAPGRLYDAAAAAARRAGAIAVAAPLGDAPELVDLVLARVDQ